jgi:hypothetical protein
MADHTKSSHQDLPENRIVIDCQDDANIPPGA